ncbi:MAG: hypothetical protein WC504_10205, partial [Methylobacter sp.]
PAFKADFYVNQPDLNVETGPSQQPLKALCTIAYRPRLTLSLISDVSFQLTALDPKRSFSLAIFL